MKWEKRVTKQLRAYLFRKIDKEKLLSELKALDENIVPGRANWRGPVIELAALKKKKYRVMLRGKLMALEMQTEVIEKALASLTEDDCTLIKRLFFTLDKEEDILTDLQITREQFSSKRGAALSCLYDELLNTRYKMSCSVGDVN